MKVLCFFNPKAGGGQAAKKLSKLKQLFEQHDIKAEIILTDYSQFAMANLQFYDLNKYDALIAAGGDGSFFDLLNAYMNNKQGVSLPLGLIPLGTGNSLSRELVQGKKDLTEFIKIIKNRQTKQIDIIKVREQKQTYYFANMMGFGFTTDVTLTAIKYKWLKKWAYIIGVLINTLKLKTYPLSYKINNKWHSIDNTFISVANSKFSGNDFLIAPNAQLDDGLFDVIIVNKINRWNLLKTFPQIFNGKYINSPFVTYFQTSKISFNSPQIKITSPDGEILGQLPISIEIVPQAIQLLSN